MWFSLKSYKKYTTYVLADVLSQDATILQVHIVHSLGQLYHEAPPTHLQNELTDTVQPVYG